MFDGFERFLLKCATDCVAVFAVSIAYGPSAITALGIMLSVLGFVASIFTTFAHRAERKEIADRYQPYKGRFDRWWDDDLDPDFERWRIEQFKKIKDTEITYYKHLWRDASKNPESTFAKFLRGRQD